MHIPIIITDPSKALFRCGLTPETMQRIDCSPGHVFEINNQAKRTMSNCGDDHRVDLILDYVDDDFFECCRRDDPLARLEFRTSHSTRYAANEGVNRLCDTLLRVGVGDGVAC